LSPSWESGVIIYFSIILFSFQESKVVKTLVGVITPFNISSRTTTLKVFASSGIIDPKT